MNKLKIEVNDKNINKIIKKTKKIRKYCDENNYTIEFIYNGKKIKKSDNLDLYNIEKTINMKSLEERYSFIYDTICDYLDKKYLECNYCDFKDNKCVFMRNNKEIIHENGCCYGENQGGLCEHLVNHKCNIKSISCKLYSCEYLRKRKVNFRMKYFPLIKYFFNIKQKYYIKYSFFKPKTYVMYKLLENK